MAFLPGKQDPTTGTQVGIDYAHYEVHSGNTFSVGANDNDLDLGQSLIIAFKTPDTAKWFHIIGIMKSTKVGLTEVLEDPTITVDSGSQINCINRNRNSSNTSGALSIETTPVANKVTINPTITADGTVLNAEYVGTGKEKGTEEARAIAEMILKQNTIYAFRITGVENDGNASIKLVWYEHINN